MRHAMRVSVWVAEQLGAMQETVAQARERERERERPRSALVSLRNVPSL